ncbi:hypothetical protein BJV82DRAFT_580953 [Fennellomyces sp. T-0311]|nr:hypothetical protein BJV82DRAFT_580953 [Fennellomyces sp. T-0311]
MVYGIQRWKIPFCKCTSDRKTLIRHHVFPATPMTPRTAVHIPFLDFYGALLLETGRVSVQAFANAIAAQHHYEKIKGVHFVLRFKYPLAVIEAFKKQYENDDINIMYDIACRYKPALKKRASEYLSKKVSELDEGDNHRWWAKENILHEEIDINWRKYCEDVSSYKKNLNPDGSLASASREAQEVTYYLELKEYYSHNDELQKQEGLCRKRSKSDDEREKNDNTGGFFHFNS